MKIDKANLKHADIIGEIHAKAWKQAYENLFPLEFIETDTVEKRKEEFLSSCKDKEIDYFLIYVSEKPIGIIKIRHYENICEILSIYLLKKYWNKGFGLQAIQYILKIYSSNEIYLWTLEANVNAQKFYEKHGFRTTKETRKINRGKEYIQLKYNYRGNSLPKEKNCCSYKFMAEETNGEIIKRS